MSSKNETVTISSNGCYAARKSADTGIVLVSYVVIMEDAPLHTSANGYSCNDRTCPCQTELDEWALYQLECPQTRSPYINPIEDDNEMYPLARRTFEYDVPEAQNGRTYRTTSSRVDWE